MVKKIAGTIAALLMLSALHTVPLYAATPTTKPAKPAPVKAPKQPAKPKIAPTLSQTFVTSLYSVNLMSDGNLSDLKILGADGQPAATVLDSTVFGKAENFSGGRKNEAQATTITKIDPQRIQVVYAIRNTLTNEVDPQALLITYTFGDAEITAEFKARPALNFGLNLAVTGQIAQNLQTMREIALPAGRGAVTGGPLQSMRVIHADGSEVLFRWTGPSNSINVNENGNINKSAWSMRGNVPNATYALTFRPIRSDGKKRVLVSPQFEFNSGVVGNIFFDGEEKAFDLTIDSAGLDLVRTNAGGDMPGGAAIAFNVTNHLSEQVEQGSIPIDLVKDVNSAGTIVKHLVVHPKLHGYYEISAQIKDVSGIFRPVAKQQPFSVVAAISNPATDRSQMMATGKFDEWARNAFVGLQLIRCSIGPVKLEDDGKILFDPKMDDLVKSNAQRAQATGVNYHHMLFEGSGLAWATTPQQLLTVYEQILARYKDQNKVWETLNEPNITWRPQDYVELYLKPLKLAAKKVQPNAKIVGGSICGLVPEFLDEIYRLGAKNYMDAVSLHPYIGVPYDVQFIPAMNRIRSVMAKYDDEKKPVWFTECGFEWRDLASQVRNARNNIRRLGIQEQYGIPNEHDFYYFTTARGYYRFNIMQNDGTLLPQAVALRARKVLLNGTAYERKLDFGVQFVLGNVYRAKDQTMLQLWTFDNTRTIQLKGNVADAKAWDIWGNEKAVTVDSDVMSVPVSGEPTYVQLAAGATIDAIPLKLGRNVADLALGAGAEASSEFQPADLAMDGRTFGGGWAAKTPVVYPLSYEISLPLPTAVNRLHVYMPESSAGGCIRDADVFGFADGKYKKIAEIRGNRDALLEIMFDTTTFQKIKLQILTGNDTRIAIYEVQLFSPTETQNATPWTNWAAAENGGKASASSTNSRLPGSFTPAGAIDGIVNVTAYKDYCATTWIDDTPGQFPDWLQVDFVGKKSINAVLVYTNNFNRYRPAETGISDADLQCWDGTEWKTVSSIAGSKKGVLAFALKEPIATDKIRLVIKASNDGYKSAVMEIQALGEK